jgi:hypothetical protein
MISAWEMVAIVDIPISNSENPRIDIRRGVVFLIHGKKMKRGRKKRAPILNVFVIVLISGLQINSHRIAGNGINTKIVEGINKTTDETKTADIMRTWGVSFILFLLL